MNLKLIYFLIIAVIVPLSDITPISTSSKYSIDLSFAQKKKKARKKKKNKRVRKKILSSEAKSKKGQSTKIDFDEASIDGKRRAPMGVAISKNKQNNEYDLINLRLKWHQEMINSTSNLETGKNR